MKKLTCWLRLLGTTAVLNFLTAPTYADVGISFPLAQIPPELKTGFQSGLGILFLVGFLWGVITIWGGAQKLKNGDSEGKMGLVSGIVIAGAAMIMGALFTIFGMADGVLQPTF